MTKERQQKIEFVKYYSIQNSFQNLEYSKILSSHSKRSFHCQKRASSIIIKIYNKIQVYINGPKVLEKMGDKDFVNDSK